MGNENHFNTALESNLCCIHNDLQSKTHGLEVIAWHTYYATFAEMLADKLTFTPECFFFIMLNKKMNKVTTYD